MQRPPNQWTDELAQKVRLLWPSHSALEIANILGRDDGVCLSRNAVIGKLTRLGMAKEFGAPRPRKETPPKPRNDRVRAEKMAAGPNIKLTTVPFVPRIVETKPLHLTLHDLTDEVCKYECSGQEDVALYTFCGAPQFKGSYCFHHAKIVYQPVRSPTPTAKAKAAA
jgi:hypothetical protein